MWPLALQVYARLVEFDFFEEQEEYRLQNRGNLDMTFILPSEFPEPCTLQHDKSQNLQSHSFASLTTLLGALAAA